MTVQTELTKEYIIELQIAEIEKLRAENQRLIDWIMGDADAHTTLQSIYLDPNAPQGNRIKAANAAIPFEKGKRLSEPAFELRAELIPLKDLLAARRARQAQLIGVMPSPDGNRIIDLLPEPNGGNGNDS
jgi:hypothetical protein